MKNDWTKTGSLSLAVLFSAWVVWLWLMPSAVENVQRPESQPEESTQSPLPQPKPSQPMVVTLPPPPKPKPMPKVSVVQAPVVKEPVAPSVKPVVSVTQQAPKPRAKAMAEKPQPVTNPVKAEPVPDPVKPEVPAVKEVKEVTQAEAVGGRALLRVLEHGKGPVIEIAWPASTAARHQLYQMFKTCFGMENALMDNQGNLFRATGPRQTRWEINLDRYSGFLRQASGQLPAREQYVMSQISRHHGRLKDPVPVRIFPRRVDASLLGGLKMITGQGYDKANNIQAQYRLKGGALLITDVRVDGRKMEGQVALPALRSCRGRA